MIRPIKRHFFVLVTVIGLSLLGITLTAGITAAQVTPMTPNTPQSNSFGLEGRISTPPPSQAARITAPSGGQSYNTALITVSGSCPRGLLVEILSNNVLVGSTYCENGSFSIQVSLFPGQNDLVARVVDDLGQIGPLSNTVSVTFNGAQFSAFGSAITLTSSFSRRGADPGKELIWPLQISGGRSPYALSIDWGDGTTLELKSQPTPGGFSISHVYRNAGIYRLTIRVTDVNGASSFLQLIAVANGEPVGGITVEETPDPTITTQTRILWQPAALIFALLIPAFILGQRYQMVAFRRRLQEDANMIKQLNIKV